MKKKVLFYPLSAILLILSISASFEFAGILKGFSISSKIELMFFIGFIVYLIIHIVFYKPLFIHVMAHELTHILWAWIFGGKTKKLEVASGGGKVLINKSNFVISLAPYFFPLYTFIFLIIYAIAKVKFLPVIAFLIGVSLSFHIALTLYSLTHSQSDLTEDSNLFFSIVFIYFMNAVVIGLVLSMLSANITFLEFFTNIFTGSWGILKGSVQFIDKILS